MSNTTQLTLGQSTNISPKTSIQSVYLECDISVNRLSDPISKNILLVPDPDSSFIRSKKISDNPAFTLSNNIALNETELKQLFNSNDKPKNVSVITSLKFGTFDDSQTTISVLRGVDTLSLSNLIELNDDHIKGLIRNWIDYTSNSSIKEYPKIDLGKITIKGNQYDISCNESKSTTKDVSYVIQGIDYAELLSSRFEDISNHATINSNDISSLQSDLSNLEIDISVNANAKNVLNIARRNNNSMSYIFDVSLHKGDNNALNTCKSASDSSTIKKCYIGTDGIYFRDHPDYKFNISTIITKSPVTNNVSTAKIEFTTSKNGKKDTSVLLEVRHTSRESYLYVNNVRAAFLGKRYAEPTYYDCIEKDSNADKKFYILTSDKDDEYLNPWLSYGSNFYMKDKTLHLPSNTQTPSDINLKTNIDYITDASMRIAEFDWKSNGSHSAGFIAQDLEKEGLGWIVSTDTDTSLKSVDYTSAFAIKIAQLENRIKQLENELQVLQLQQPRRLGGY